MRLAGAGQRANANGGVGGRRVGNNGDNIFIRRLIALICASHLLSLEPLQAYTLGEHVTSEQAFGLMNEPTEDYFNQILTDLCERDEAAQAASCTRQADIESIGRKIERVTGKLVDLSKGDEKLLRSMQTALDVKDLTSSLREKSPQRRLERTRSVWNAVEAPARDSALIVRRTLMIDVDTLRSQFGHDFNTKLPAHDRRIWLDASKELISKQLKYDGDYDDDDDDDDEETASAVLIKLGLAVGSTLLDHFYSTPEFMLNIPIIGKKLIEIRRKCEPIYHAIDLIRRTHAYFKLKAAEGEARLSGDKGRYGKLQEQSNSAKLLVSRASSNMLRILVERVMAGAMGTQKMIGAPSAAEARKEDRTECTIRLFYAVLSQIISFESQCTK